MILTIGGEKCSELAALKFKVGRGANLAFS